MTSNQPKQSSAIKYQSLPLSKENFIKLLENKKAKLVKKYIFELSQGNSEVQQIIKDVFEQFLIAKKFTTVTAFFYLLVFYKNLLVSAQLDYYEYDQLFPMQIHQTIAKLCEFNMEQPQLKKKGVDLFTKLYKPLSTNESQNIQALGGSSIILISQLIHCMSQWYKNDYFTGEKSHFYFCYEKLKKKKFPFTDIKDNIYVKEQDGNQFKANYQQFLAREEELQQGSQKKQTPREKAQIKQKDSTVKITTQSKKQETKQSIIQKQQSSKQPLNIAKKQSQKQKEMSDSNPSLIVKKQLDSIITSQLAKQSPSKVSKGSQIKQPIKQHIKQSIKQPSSVKNIIKQNKSDAARKSLLNQMAQKSKNHHLSAKIQQPIQKKQIIKQKSTVPQQKPVNNPAVKQQKQKPQQKNQKINNERKSILQNSTNNNPPKNQINVQFQQNKIKVQPKPQIKKQLPSSQNKNINSKLTENPIKYQTPIKNLKKHQQLQIHAHKSNSKNLLKQISQKNELRSNSNKKIRKTEKPSLKNEALNDKLQENYLKLRNPNYESPNNLKMRTQQIESNVQRQSYSKLKPAQKQQPANKTNKSRDQKRHHHTQQKQAFMPRKRSVPKTQKKHTQNMQNLQDLSKSNLIDKLNSTHQKLYANFLLNENTLIESPNKKLQYKHKKSNRPQLVLNKTLSTWRQQKQYTKGPSQQHLKNYSLVQLIKKIYQYQSRLSFKYYEKRIKINTYNKTYQQSSNNNSDNDNSRNSLAQQRMKTITEIQFVPEYFQPITLKMHGLRRSALHLYNYPLMSIQNQDQKLHTQQSFQPFFNNNQIEARLIKYSNNQYSLSLLNVTKSQRLALRQIDCSHGRFTHQIKMLSKTLTTQKSTYLHPSEYLDIRFMFFINDLNFRFLPFLLLVNGQVLPLELPITLLDCCVVHKQMSLNNISNNLQIINKEIKVLQKQKQGNNNKSNSYNKSIKLIKSTPIKFNQNHFPSFMTRVSMMELDTCCHNVHHHHKNNLNNLSYTQSKPFQRSHYNNNTHQSSGYKAMTTNLLDMRNLFPSSNSKSSSSNFNSRRNKQQLQQSLIKMKASGVKQANIVSHQKQSLNIISVCSIQMRKDALLYQQKSSLYKVDCFIELINENYYQINMIVNNSIEEEIKQTNEVNINDIYQTNNQDFAKVIIELLAFLMVK